MSHRAVRVIVFLLAVGCVGGAGYLLTGWMTRSWRSAAPNAYSRARHTRPRCWSSGSAPHSSRMWPRARARVLDGQGGRHAQLARAHARRSGDDRNRRSPRRRRRAARSVSSGQHTHLDARARTYMADGQRLMASDLIFTELNGVTSEIEPVRRPGTDGTTHQLGRANRRARGAADLRARRSCGTRAVLRAAARRERPGSTGRRTRARQTVV